MEESRGRYRRSLAKFRVNPYSVADQRRYCERNPHIKFMDPSAILAARRTPAQEEIRLKWLQESIRIRNQSLTASKEKVEEGGPLLKRPREDLLADSTVDNPNPAADSSATDAAAGTKAEVGGGSLLKRPRQDLGNSGETSVENPKPEEADPSAASVDNPKPDEADSSAASGNN